MADGFIIPENLKVTYQRMLNTAPEQLRAKADFRHLTLLHLRVGGERLARQNMQLFRIRLEEDYIFGRGFLQDRDEGENGPDDADASTEDDDTGDTGRDDDDYDDDAADDEPADDDEPDDDDSDEIDRLALPGWEGAQPPESMWAGGSD